MRPIGTLPDAKAAAVFSDFLVAKRIANQTERESDGSFTVWIMEDDQLAAGGALLAEFQAAPTSAKFSTASQDAEAVRRAQADDLEAYRRRIRTADGLFPKMGGYGIGILSYLLIAVCIGVAIYTMLGSKRAAVAWMFIDDPQSTGFLTKVRQGEVWRLITPIFLHFGPLHLIFNMSWIYHLGCMIEARRSVLTLALLVVLVGLGSNFAQYVVSGHANFGGMSGVVYGLVGYVWMRGKYDRASGVFLDRRSLIISLVWLVACYTGWLGPVANTAHLSGLILGMVFGRVAAWRSLRNPK